MTVFDTAMNDPNPSDRDLVRMYRAFSEEMWCAGWLSGPECMGNDFIKWLRNDYAKYRSQTEEWDLHDFEVAGLPALRRLYAEAFGARQLEDRTKGVIDSNSPPSYRTIEIPEAIAVKVTDESLTAELHDGRTISVPLSWYPRLTHATPEERDNWELIGTGEGIHWPDLDEDISIEMLLAGVPSGESQGGFKRWLQAKQAGLQVNIYEIKPTVSEEV